MNQLNQFQISLESNPRLQYSTIHSYLGAMHEVFLKLGESPTIEQLNFFIAEKCRKRQPYFKYAIKEYLKFIGRGEEIYKLVQAKIRPPIRQKIFLSREQLIDIVESIPDEKFKAIARIQLASARRSAEIINIETNKIKIEEYYDKQLGQNNQRIRISIRGKGDKPGLIYLKKGFERILQPFIEKKEKYLFIAGGGGLSNYELWTTTRSIYKMYLTSLQDAAKKCGIKMATHDIRRSVANMHDKLTAQMLLSHTDLRTTERYLADDSEKISDILLKHQEGL